MKKKSILVFGLIAAMLVVSLSSFTGHGKVIPLKPPRGVLVILPNNGCCVPGNSAPCWADVYGCEYCCNEFEMNPEWYTGCNDKFCCGCCDMPW